MSHPINRTLLTILDNQAARTDAALDDLREDVFTTDAPEDCHSIRDIGRHLVLLRRFQMMLLGSARAESVAAPEAIDTVDDLRSALDAATRELRAAIEEHDPDDWYVVPDPPREGKWGELPTIERFSRPFADFTNHLGSIRVLRRIRRNACERTQ